MEGGLGHADKLHDQRRNDGLRYTDLYLTAGVRCVPPDNRPTAEEEARCRPFLVRELRLLSNARAFLALGGFAWDALRNAASSLYDEAPARAPFAHGAVLPLGAGRPMLWGSYHPSPQNTNTGKLTSTMLVDLLRRIRAYWS